MRAVAGLSRLLTTVLQPVVALTLFAILVVMVADVFGRYLFNRPIRGAYEITEFLMCLMVAGALPLVSLWGRHVEASLVADLAPRLTPALFWVAGVASALVFGYLAILLWGYGGQLSRQNAQSLFGGVPRAPFARYMAVMCALAALASAIALIRHDPGPQLPEGRDE